MIAAGIFLLANIAKIFNKESYVHIFYRLIEAAWKSIK
jgi:hypothetical protein